MPTHFIPTIGLEIHAELLTQSKMFCACPVVDVTRAPPNTAVCPICAGMPGTLPVVNRRAVEFALRVALALDCEINQTSLFARKNYFYPDLPKGYQISQYEQPLARHGRLPIRTSQGERDVRIRRVHLEEDTGKSTHIAGVGDVPEETPPARSVPVAAPLYSLIDLNRAGIPLLEIVTEPELHSPEEVGAFARTLRTLLRYLEVTSGDLQKGVLRIEPNISISLAGSAALGTRTEVKNLNSFRALERAVEYEINRQIAILQAGGQIVQETVGWDEARQATFPQRAKEEAHDYRYFPEPDLPPLVIEDSWLQTVRKALPELPHARFQRFLHQYDLNAYDADLLTSERPIADYFEQTVAAAPSVSPKTIANWITGELFALLNESERPIYESPLTPPALGELLRLLDAGAINPQTAKHILAEMFATGQSAPQIIAAQGLQQISDADYLAELVDRVLESHPDQVSRYLEGKQTVFNWLLGQVMQRAGGRANPQIARQILKTRLDKSKV